ncbi:P-loop containing nucleoside triphosphate hydrolase protein [Tribonema minus]|uniref:Kinesin-like protein n=1 Tax=Tribonema minus TaxID=303371 RepID=A0A835ZBM3_9STRA|nr:P-loop containing nucleoside triphosphate hydrolase protein [Tribonema minus]
MASTPASPASAPPVSADEESGADKIRVVVRVRPLSQAEQQADASALCLKRLSPQSLKYGTDEENADSGMTFTFDQVFWSESQQQVCDKVGVSVVRNAWKGLNSSVFAYGQTGSGKTHTMTGQLDDLQGEGLIPRISRSLFSTDAAADEAITSFKVVATYYEIYNERVIDLLGETDAASPRAALRVREHPTRGPFVEGAVMREVGGWADLAQLLRRGNRARTVASTKMNAASSRSHAILQLSFVQTRIYGADDGGGEFGGGMRAVDRESKITLVDLAGSERADKTGVTGDRLVESGNINKSLLALGSVINALAESVTSTSTSSVFVPYRNSALTWLLRESLGGNARSVMVATLSPSALQREETGSTLRYAERAKRIKTHATVNEDPNVAIIRQLRAEIEALKAALREHMEKSSGSGSSSGLAGSRCAREVTGML